MKKMLFFNDCQIRDETEHRDRVGTLQTLSKKAKVYWSKKWGVNTESVLIRIPGFSMSKRLLHDPMHVLRLHTSFRCALKDDKHLMIDAVGEETRQRGLETSSEEVLASLLPNRTSSVLHPPCER